MRITLTLHRLRRRRILDLLDVAAKPAASSGQRTGQMPFDLADGTLGTILVDLGPRPRSGTAGYPANSDTSRLTEYPANEPGRAARPFSRHRIALLYVKVLR